MSRPTKVIAQNESCKITRTSSDFEFFTDYKHEVHDRERGEVLSKWKSSKRLLERLKEANHRLAADFEDWYNNNGGSE